MADLQKRFPFGASRWSPPFDALTRTPSELMDSIERMFGSGTGPSPLRIEEFVENKALVIRAEMPGVDPDKDIEVTVSEGALHIRAERQEKEEHKDKDGFRSEFRYGAFSRSIPLPEGIKQEDIKASYTDGVLEVRTPLPEPAVESGRRKLPITRG
jgi:HSP20 family protein